MIGKPTLKMVEERAKEHDIPGLMSRIKPEHTESIKIFEENSYKLGYYYF